MPKINFNYFDTGTTTDGADTRDLDAVVKGLQIARKIAADLSLVFSANFTEVFPGTAVATEDQMRDYVKDNAWGHHASCTCPIGVDNDPMAVLDSNFNVRGVDALRVVDASVFPRIPGIFIAVPVYMISEKAADVILATAK
jgi:choline dehydrogenase